MTCCVKVKGAVLEEAKRAIVLHRQTGSPLCALCIMAALSWGDHRLLIEQQYASSRHMQHLRWCCTPWQECTNMLSSQTTFRAEQMNV